MTQSIRSLKLFAPFALLAVLPACPLLDVQASVSEACLAYPGLQVAGAAPGTQAIQQDAAFNDLAAIHALASAGANLEFVRATATALDGVPDLSFVHAAKLTIASGDAGSTLPTLEVYSCDGDCLPGGTTLEIPAAAQQDALDYAKGNSIIVGVTLAGPVPTTAWSMDLSVCVRGNIDYQVSP